MLKIEKLAHIDTIIRDARIQDLDVTFTNKKKITIKGTATPKKTGGKFYFESLKGKVIVQWGKEKEKYTVFFTRNQQVTAKKTFFLKSALIEYIRDKVKELGFIEKDNSVGIQIEPELIVPEEVVTNKVDQLIIIIRKIDPDIEKPKKVMRYTPSSMYSSEDHTTGVGSIGTYGSGGERYYEIITPSWTELTLGTYNSFRLDEKGIDEEKKNQISSLLSEITLEEIAESKYIKETLKSFI